MSAAMNDLLIQLQAFVDGGAYLNFASSGKYCRGVVVGPNGMPERCTHRPIVEHGRKVRCDLDHAHKSSVRHYCLFHELQMIAGQESDAPLLDVMRGRASVWRPYDVEPSESPLASLLEAEQAFREKNAGLPPATFVHYEETEAIEFTATTVDDGVEHVPFERSENDYCYCVCGWFLEGTSRPNADHDIHHETWKSSLLDPATHADREPSHEDAQDLVAAGAAAREAVAEQEPVDHLSALERKRLLKLANDELETKERREIARVILDASGSAEEITKARLNLKASAARRGRKAAKAKKV